jgi:hypothetical protein
VCFLFFTLNFFIVHYKVQNANDALRVCFSLLVHLGQVVMGMQQNAGGGLENPVAQAAAAAASSLAKHAGNALSAFLNQPGSGKGLLGDVPKPSMPNDPAALRFMKTLEAVAAQVM